MANAANIFNNTILVPTSGFPEEVPDIHFGTDLQKYNKKNADTAIKNNAFRVFINIGGASIPMKYCQNILMLEVRRDAEEHRSGGNASYITKVPGRMSYSPINFTHFYCTNDVFLTWLINGVNQGGIQTATIEIKVGKEKDHMVYTLRDAFPISWSLGTFTVDLEGMVQTGELLAYMITENQILCENLTVAYSKIEYIHETSSWGI